ncbi:MAG: hypothetical protein JWN32_2187 [Solirubrobacterales bacterium]|nr:hypothetical protein [Solirubrobacterales bacterium]
MTKMLRRPAVLGLAGAALALAPAAAHAATITVNDPCPRVGIQNASVPITATGFTPGEQVAFYYNDFTTAITTAVADGAGGMSGGLPAPDIGTHNQATETVLAKGLQSGATANSPAFPVVTPKVNLPNRGRPTSRVLYKVYGFNNGQPVYAHYSYHGHQKVVKKLGTAKAPCGLLQKRLQFLPTTFHAGEWVYHFNNSKSKPNKTPLYEIKYQFSRVFRSRAFGASAPSALGRALGF